MTLSKEQQADLLFFAGWQRQWDLRSADIDGILPGTIRLFLVHAYVSATVHRCPFCIRDGTHRRIRAEYIGDFTGLGHLNTRRREFERASRISHRTLI